MKHKKHPKKHRFHVEFIELGPEVDIDSLIGCPHIYIVEAVSEDEAREKFIRYISVRHPSGAFEIQHIDRVSDCNDPP